MKAADPASNQRSGTTKMILLVEDSPDIRELATSSLRSADLQVVDAANAEQALELLSSLDTVPDLLITDLMLPGLNGQELASRVREQYPSIRVLFTTGYGAESVDLDHSDAAHTSHLQKPFSLRVLRQRVRDMLDLQIH